MQFIIDIALTFLYFAIFLIVCAWMWRFWIGYIQQKHLNSIDWLMLEVKLPRELNKSPYAAELAISSLLQTGGIGNKYAKAFKGGMPIFASLEIASLEGTIHFYIRFQSKFKALVEGNFYAQFPGIELIEVDDYTKKIRYHHLSKDVSCWGVTYALSKKWKPTNPKTGKPYSKTEGITKEPKDDEDHYEMPADFLPIKTYVDYGLDKDPKEEYRIDPLAQMLEVMGSLGKGEYFWYQVILTDESNFNKKKWPFFYVNERTHEHINLAKMADERKKQIRTSHYLKDGDKVMDDYGGIKQIQTGKDKDGNPIYVDATYKYKEPKAVGKDETKLTFEEKAELEGIVKKLSKPIVLATVRSVYVAEKSRYNGQYIQLILSLMKPFAGINSFAPGKLADPYDFPWENFMGRRVPWRTEEIFEAYVEREAFFPHIGERKSLSKWEDSFFWTSSMNTRKMFRMFYEMLLYPFDHPQPGQVHAFNLEEIATLWHFPGANVATPTLPRIDSTKGVAPTNLPI